MAVKHLISEIGFNDGEPGWALTYGLGLIANALVGGVLRRLLVNSSARRMPYRRRR